ncbi:hypothetical protein OM318_22135 [Escherichia albertii]|uniref:hypothetical protein n=1 Tax=Escherichia albertii TaxID=208962 RepID=UPI001A13B572|nr:hypothetical protein [Escherichia albertii]MCU7297435.1 hypothetical protein [Escherichia albertii]MCU7306752.1 hypothetical protein [Escherichia albertii]MCZ8925794.1 hypothetical protein [Escherichia albertii]MCZ9155114.1 hypothetical protein [Escherichia albertii]MCZ9164510.1 hypothetical protein [Escherichia albertii]
MKKYIKLVFLVLLTSMLLGGCESKPGIKPLQQTTGIKLVSSSGDRLDDVEKMERCRRELEALKRIDSAVYNKRKAEFDKLVSGASLYNGVRNDVGNYTQSAVDALYRFRSDKLCADIASDVLVGLTK